MTVHCKAWLLLALTAAIPAQNTDTAVVTWRGDVQPLTVMTQDEAVPETARRAMQQWSAWADERGYRLVLSESGRVLMLFSPTYARRAEGRKEDNTVRRFVRSVDEVVTRFDALMPDTPAHTVVVVGARSADYGDVLQQVAERNPALGTWVSATARLRSGFTLADPRLSVWLEDPPGNEEWNPENELVHRAAAALWADHAEHAPAWLRLGLAWHLEERVMQSIYCFPHRAGFVSVYDHTDWDKTLKQKFRKRKKRPFQLAEIADWVPRTRFDPLAATLAFGVARYLADHHSDALPGLLTSLHEITDKNRRVKTGPHSWAIDTEYVLPVELQERLIAEHTSGGDVEVLGKEITRYFQRGMRGPRR